MDRFFDDGVGMVIFVLFESWRIRYGRGRKGSRIWFCRLRRYRRLGIVVVFRR